MARKSSLTTWLTLLSLSSAYVPSAVKSSVLYPRQLSNGCEALKQQDSSKIFTPNTTEYEQLDSEYWSVDTVLSPTCIFTPESVQDVASAVKLLVGTQTKFAVRSGGHMPIPGAAGTNDGVLIAMDRLTSHEISGNVAKLGPGLRWIEVYDWLADQGLTVVGGRYSPVGVGGYSIGGGISYYISQVGWASDHVKNFEVVTADGNIIHANADSNSDLYWALKGGTFNFGIVTRFDLEIFPLPETIWGGFALSDASQVDRWTQAVGDYVTGPDGGNFDKACALNPTLTFTMDTRLLGTQLSLFYNASVAEEPRAFENFTSIPTTTLSTLRQRNLTDFLSETASTGTRGSNYLFGATSLRASVATAKLQTEVFREATANLRNISQAIATLGLQTIAGSSIQAAVDAGGDAIGLDPADGGFFAVLVTVEYPDSADSDYLRDWVNDVLATLDERSKAAGDYYPYIYLNDAGQGQKPLQLYGKDGANFQKMKDVATKYDPKGVFQELATGEFKLSK